MVCRLCAYLLGTSAINLLNVVHSADGDIFDDVPLVPLDESALLFSLAASFVSPAPMVVDEISDHKV
jgi:hypothetical protein